jgi:hypothetical protein
MFRLRPLILIIALQVVPAGQPSASPFLPVGQAEYQFLYDIIRRNEIIDGHNAYNLRVGPYNLGQIDFKNPLRRMMDVHGSDYLHLFLILSEDYSAARYSRASGFESVRGGFLAEPAKYFFVYADGLLDERMADDPEYEGKKWRGLAGETESAFIAYSRGHFDFMLGRFSSSWGPDSRSLVLSMTSRPMDAVSWRFRWGRLNFTYQLGKLAPLYPAGEQDDSFENRFFVGHRIDLRIIKRLEIGLFETAIFGGPGRNIELSYLNPLLFYYAVQLNENIDDNILLGFDVCWFLDNRHKLYGQLLIDDVQIDHKEPGDNEPDELGFLLGFETIGLLHQCDLQGQYVRINNRTYNQRLIRNRYFNRGKLIGDDLGPDSDLLSLSLIRWIRTDTRLALNGSFRRRGEGRCDDVWEAPWISIDNYHESFPSGVVEKDWCLSVKWSGFYKERVFYDFEAGLHEMRNRGNIEDAEATIPFFQGRLSLFFFSLFDIE